MTTAALHDYIAAKMLELSGVKVAYADGSTSTANVQAMPRTIVAMPAVLVRRGETARTMGISRELYVREWLVDFYLPMADAGLPVRWINNLDDKMLVELRQDVNLGGNVSICRFLGSNPPDLREEGEGPAAIQYVVWTCHLQTEERVGTTYTVT